MQRDDVSQDLVAKFEAHEKQDDAAAATPPRVSPCMAEANAHTITGDAAPLQGVTFRSLKFSDTKNARNG